MHCRAAHFQWYGLPLDRKRQVHLYPQTLALASFALLCLCSHANGLIAAVSLKPEIERTFVEPRQPPRQPLKVYLFGGVQKSANYNHGDVNNNSSSSNSHKSKHNHNHNHINSTNNNSKTDTNNISDNSKHSNSDSNDTLQQ